MNLRGRTVPSPNNEPKSVTKSPAEWNQRYLDDNTPWDSRIPSHELIRTLNEELIEPCRVAELGCGSGTNAIYLASRGFEVTGIDCAKTAMEFAQTRADEALVAVEWIEADISEFQIDVKPFEFVFDRGCYHAVRRSDPAGYLRTLEKLTQPGSRFLVLTGNANEEREHGPPALREDEIRADLEKLFNIQWIREFHFEDAGGVEGPLGWSSLMIRRG